jgi:hypothetical protein
VGTGSREGFDRATSRERIELRDRPERGTTAPFAFAAVQKPKLVDLCDLSPQWRRRAAALSSQKELRSLVRGLKL